MKCSSTFPTMILLFGAIILFSAFLRAIESGTLFTISDSGMKGALNKVLEQYFRIFARHKELEKYFRDLVGLVGCMSSISYLKLKIWQVFVAQTFRKPNFGNSSGE